MFVAWIKSLEHLHDFEAETKGVLAADIVNHYLDHRSTKSNVPEAVGIALFDNDLEPTDPKPNLADFNGMIKDIWLSNLDRGEEYENGGYNGSATF